MRFQTTKQQQNTYSKTSTYERLDSQIFRDTSRRSSEFLLRHTSRTVIYERASFSYKATKYRGLIHLNLSHSVSSRSVLAVRASL